MRNYIFALFAGLLIMVACLPVPAAIDMGSQVTLYVKQSIALPESPAISNYDAPVNKYCPNAHIDSKIFLIDEISGISQMVKAPPKFYTCGVSVEVEKKFNFKDFWNLLQNNLWWIATILLTLSEGLGLTDKVKANSILQLLFSWLRRSAAKKPT